MFTSDWKEEIIKHANFSDWVRPPHHRICQLFLCLFLASCFFFFPVFSPFQKSYRKISGPGPEVKLRSSKSSQIQVKPNQINANLEWIQLFNNINLHPQMISRYSTSESFTWLHVGGDGENFIWVLRRINQISTFHEDLGYFLILQCFLS